MQHRDKVAAIFMGLFVWGFAGALFGALFAGLYQLLVGLGIAGWLPLLIAATIAATTTSAFYSAMPVALAGAMAGVLASIAYLIATGHQVELPLIAGLAGLAGVLAGGFYAWAISSGARPLAQTFSGLLAGLLAGTVLALLLGLSGIEVGMFTLAAGVVALVGSIYQFSVRRLAHAADWLPGGLSAPVVAGLIASVVGASVWIVGGTTAGLHVAPGAAFEAILAEVPAGLLGGALGGALTGLLLESLGIDLQAIA
ncbi:spermidine synthase [Marichromatium sp. AB31]|uniref:spermidine synthase n=1 Tax=Marichromatium sp. AB31 TaxID=2483362 RepID=UPI000F3CBBBF|nr:spermidine synthase [Marichromatium sp. AB31]RNE91678.1 spermidine synthase [Marichromatium sp. AB31]